MFSCGKYTLSASLSSLLSLKDIFSAVARIHIGFVGRHVSRCGRVGRVLAQEGIGNACDVGTGSLQKVEDYKIFHPVTLGIQQSSMLHL